MTKAVGQTPDYTVKTSQKYLDDERQVKYRSTLIGVGWKKHR